jgi:hypothetical protein
MARHRPKSLPPTWPSVERSHFPRPPTPYPHEHRLRPLSHFTESARDIYGKTSEKPRYRYPPRTSGYRRPPRDDRYRHTSRYMRAYTPASEGLFTSHQYPRAPHKNPDIQRRIDAQNMEIASRPDRPVSFCSQQPSNRTDNKCVSFELPMRENKRVQMPKATGEDDLVQAIRGMNLRQEEQRPHCYFCGQELVLRCEACDRFRRA